MVEDQTARAHHRGQLAAIQRQVGVADMFEHPDADHLVELAVRGQIAVIQQLKLDAALEPLGRHALAPEP